MTPLRITAELVNGYVTRDPWSPALDGIVASEVMRERLGEEAFVLGGAGVAPLAPVEGLPFAVERDGAHWWYSVSCPTPVGLAGVVPHALHRRFDDAQERHLAADVRRVMTAAGPYKGARLPVTRTLCAAIEWHAIGNAAALQAVLARVEQIGGRRGSGYGAVRGWLVSKGGDPALARRWRPLPADYARREGVAGLTLLRGLAPPSRCNQVECVVPAPHAPG